MAQTETIVNEMFILNTYKHYIIFLAASKNQDQRKL